MEKILIGIDKNNIDLRPCIHAINLAKRMNRTKLYCLMILDKSKIKSDNPYDKIEIQRKESANVKNEQALEVSPKNDLESLIEDGRSKGIIIDYYMVEGNFQDEIINFVKSHRIDLFVIGSPLEKTNLTEKEAFTEFIEKIRHKIDCRIEVVHGEY